MELFSCVAVLGSAHPPIPPRAPILRPGAPPHPNDPPRSTTPSPYYGSGNIQPQREATKPKRSNSLHGRDGRENPAYHHGDKRNIDNFSRNAPHDRDNFHSGRDSSHNAPHSRDNFHNNPRGSSRSHRNNFRNENASGERNVPHIQLKEGVSIRHASMVWEKNREIQHNILVILSWRPYQK